MPIITIESWPFETEKKKQMIEKITEVFTSFEIPKQAITIVFHENPLENWGSGGEQHSEKFKDMIKK